MKLIQRPTGTHPDPALKTKSTLAKSQRDPKPSEQKGGSGVNGDRRKEKEEKQYNAAQSAEQNFAILHF